MPRRLFPVPCSLFPVLIVFLFLFPVPYSLFPAFAQGPYTFSGATSFGYRFVDVNGSQAKYNELLNLQEGFRVFDLQLNFVPAEPASAGNPPGNQWFDRASFSAQSLGGDPFPVLRAQVRKNGVYEIEAGYRASQYIYDLPQTAFTPNRGWNDRRRFTNAELRYWPARDLRLRFFYHRTEREGSDLATGPFFYFPLSPDVWAAFGRANALPWVIPLREKANLYGAGLDFHLGKTSLHLEQSYRTYNNPASLRGFPNQPFELLGPGSPLQNLVVRKWDAFAGFNIPATSIRVDQEVTRWAKLRAGYIYTHASGPVSLDGTVESPALPGLPESAFSVNFTGTGATLRTTHTAEAGLTLKLLEQLDFLSDYRYQTYFQQASKALEATRSDSPAPTDLGVRTERWDFGLHTLSTVLAVTPLSTLSVRAGLRFFKEDIVRKQDDRTVRGTRRSWSYAPVISASWRASEKLRLTGQFETRTVVDPYVRITPEDMVGALVRVRFQPGDKWGIENTFSFRNWETEDQSFEMRHRANTSTLWYQPLEKLGIQAGATYGSFYSENSIAYIRGTPPLTGLLSVDQTIDRNYFWGVKANPAGSLNLAFTGQFTRATGISTFTQEASNYGPLTWPAWTAEASYDVPDVGRLGFDWQRSYYYEDLFRATEYGANGFTLRFERAF